MVESIPDTEPASIVDVGEGCKDMELELGVGRR